MQPLASNIKFLRKKRGQTQQELSEILGYNNSTTILKWETDKADPPVKTVKALSEYYGVDLESLVYSDLNAVENKSIEILSKNHIKRMTEYWNLLEPEEQEHILDLAKLFAKQKTDNGE